MNVLAIISLLFLMSYSKPDKQKVVPFSEVKLLQIKRVFLKNFSKYLISKNNISNVNIEKSTIGIKNSKQLFLNLKYSYINTFERTNLYKKTTVIIEPTANAYEWKIKNVVNNTEEIQFQKALIISL